MEKIILAINPGSTSTKLALYKDSEVISVINYKHEKSSLSTFLRMYDQLSFRMTFVDKFLEENKMSLDDISLVVGRGGLLKPLKKSGTYLVNSTMIEDLKTEKYGTHASNLGAIMAYEVAKKIGQNAYIVDPVIVDEMDNIAKVTGLKEIEKICIFHALNQKSIAKKYANDIGKKYEELNIIVAHLGGGISVGWHKLGKVVDVNNALGGEGPFSPERRGTLPALQLVELVLKNKLTYEELRKMIVTKGGLTSYLGTNDGVEINRRIEAGSKEDLFYLEAMAYQIAKEIGSLYFASCGEAKTVILTGGLAYLTRFTDMICNYLNNIVKVEIYPGENEMESLVHGVLRVVDEIEDVNIYS